MESGMGFVVISVVHTSLTWQQFNWPLLAAMPGRRLRLCYFRQERGDWSQICLAVVFCGS
jgi:hypothetical protein